MAMTIRLTPELDEKLRLLADSRHVSKHALILQSIEVLVLQSDKTKSVLASVERTLERDSELLARLADS